MKKLTLTNLIKYILIPSFCLIYCICCNYVNAEAKDYIQKGIGDGNTTLMQVPWTAEMASKYFLHNKDGSNNNVTATWIFKQYALVDTTKDRVANNAATKSWNSITANTIYNIPAGKSLAIKTSDACNFPFGGSPAMYSNIFLIRVPWNNISTNINSILNYTYDINIGEDANPAAANAYNCETIAWAFTAMQYVDIIVRVESALINKTSVKYINLYFDTVTATGTRKFGFRSNTFYVYALGSGYDADFIEYLTLLQILTQLTSGVPVNVSGLSLDGDITIDMSNVEQYLQDIINNQQDIYHTDDSIAKMVGDIYDLLASQPTQDQSGTTQALDDGNQTLQDKITQFDQFSDSIDNDLTNYSNQINLNQYDIFNTFTSTSTYFKNILDTYFTNCIGDFKAIIIVPVIVTVLIILLGHKL